MKLCTIADCKTFLGTSPGDALLTLFVEQASQQIEHYLGYKLSSATRTEYYSTTHETQLLNLRAAPIGSITSINIDAGWDFEAASLVSSDDYTFDDYTVYFNYDISAGYRHIKVVYVAGTANATFGTETIVNVPDDLQKACMRQALFEFARRREIGAKSVNQKTGTVQPDLAIWDHVALDIIERYRRREICWP